MEALKRRFSRTEKDSNSVSVINLGCPKNLVTAENLSGYFKENGYSLHNLFTTFSPVDVAVVNTCSFIRSARREALQTIKRVLEYKNKGMCKYVIVTGCYTQRFLSDLNKKVPGVDFICSNSSVNEISNFLGLPEENKSNINRIPSTNSYAYLKIADGCDRNCSFCLIPSIKGSYQSRPVSTIFKEAEMLSYKFNIKELILVAQDTGSYGEDLSNRIGLIALVGELAKIRNLKWIRIMYLYPTVNKEFLKELLSIDKVVSYLDIPLQHSSPEILKSMNRPTDVSRFTEDLVKLRDEFKNLTIRSTFIVGFPGENDSIFQELLDFLDRYKFDRAGFFAFSREKFTKAYSLPDQISSATKEERLKTVYEVQSRISSGIRKKFIGKLMDAIIEGFDENGGYAFGRTERDAPEIDEGVIIRGDNEYLMNMIGEIVKIKVVDAIDYNLIGEV